MEEYKLRQLMDQEGKIIDAYASGDMEMVERKFNAIVGFILNKEPRFLDGIKSDGLKREDKISKAKAVFVEGIKKAAELVEDDQVILEAFKCFEVLQGVEQGIMSRFPYEIVESVSSYIKELQKKPVIADK